VGRLKRRKRREMLQFTLNVTSLMDVLTVLLFFLVKSYSVSQAALQIPQGMRLPASTVKGELEETVALALSNKELRFNNQVLLTLENGKFNPKDIGKDGKTITQLKHLLDDEYAKRNTLFSEEGTTDNLPPGRVIIQSDKQLEFAVLKFVLHTAAQAHYNDYEFVVENPED
jgi:biopolymer transport protein ExbD